MESPRPVSPAVSSGRSTDYLQPQLEYSSDLRTDHDLEKHQSITRTLTRIRTNVLDEPGPPPDGGLLAWTQVAIAHLVVINTWGTINSFGIFQSYYTTILNRPPSDISWIGSVQVFFLFGIGVLTGRLTDAGYFRIVLATGSFLVVLGSSMASISSQYWQIFLSQGACIGLGMGCLFCPMVAVLSTYFSHHRNLAIGIAISGSSTGGVVYPAMARALLSRIGFGWTMRSMAFVQFATLLVANIFVRSRLPPRKSGPIVELVAFRERPYTLFAIGMFFNFWGVYFAFYYISGFSREILGFSYPNSLNLLMIMNGVGAIGRIVPAYLADLWLGPLDVIIPAAATCMLLLFCWNTVDSIAALYLWAVVYGIFGATVQGLFPAGLSSLTTDLSKAGSRMGMVYTIISFANLTGPPLAGALISRGNGKYIYAFVFGGTSLCIGSGFLIACRIAKGGLKFKAKV